MNREEKSFGEPSPEQIQAAAEALIQKLHEYNERLGNFELNAKEEAELDAIENDWDRVMADIAHAGGKYAHSDLYRLQVLTDRVEKFIAGLESKKQNP